ncbi:MAG: hypothetical protein ACI8Q1_001918 [Parvicella sp.]|jgi:hypothetical protein
MAKIYSITQGLFTKMDKCLQVCLNAKSEVGMLFL